MPLRFERRSLTLHDQVQSSETPVYVFGMSVYFFSSAPSAAPSAASFKKGKHPSSGAPSLFFGVKAMTLYCDPMPVLSMRRLAALSISFLRSGEAARSRPARRGWRPRDVRKVDCGRGPWEVARLANRSEKRRWGGSGRLVSDLQSLAKEAIKFTNITQGLCQVREVDVGGKIGVARLRKRVYDLMLAEAL